MARTMNMKSLRLNWERQFDREEIDRFRNVLKDYADGRNVEIDSKKEQIVKLPNENDPDTHEQLASLDDDSSFLGELINMGDELSILALYKKIEITRKRILMRELSGRWGIELSERELSDINYINKKIPINLDNIEGAFGVDALRCISNAIKHEGVVTKEMELCGGCWQRGQKLTGLGQEYERLAIEAEKYIRALIDSVTKYNKKKSNKHRKSIRK